MDLFRLSDKAQSAPNELSGGMQRRVLFARALMHHPALLILDEPTAGIDVELRTELWEFIRRLHASGTTVLLTTHYLEAAEALCDEIGLLRAGRIIARGSAAKLRAHYGADDIAGVYAHAMSGPTGGLEAVA
jgi:ABC-2 type transport system ATP-binding protein